MRDTHWVICGRMLAAWCTLNGMWWDVGCVLYAEYCVVEHWANDIYWMVCCRMLLVWYTLSGVWWDFECVLRWVEC